MVKCNKCGNIFRPLKKGSPSIVNGCSKCTKLFSDETAEKIIKDFFREV